MASKRDPPRDLALKVAMYEYIRQQFRLSGTIVTRAEAKRVFDGFIDQLFTSILKEKEGGFFRLPFGYGAFKVKRFRAKPTRKLPTRPAGSVRGKLLKAPVAKSRESLHLRFVEGALTKRALGTYRQGFVRTNSGNGLGLPGDRVPGIFLK